MKLTLQSELGQILTGRTAEHLVPVDDKHQLHPETLDAFFLLQEAAKEEGFDLQIVSSFRDYNAQERVWNRKASGERQLLDAQSKPLDFSSLSPEGIIRAIMRWSALPGASRHHWGTDLDIYDAHQAKLEDVELVPEEYASNGPFGKMNAWLTERMKRDDAFGFYRPYTSTNNGISPEAWHLSFAPVAKTFYQHYSFDLYLENISLSNILLKKEVTELARDLYKTYFQKIDLP